LHYKDIPDELRSGDKPSRSRKIYQINFTTAIEKNETRRAGYEKLYAGRPGDFNRRGFGNTSVMTMSVSTSMRNMACLAALAAAR
jgi:hypothetical protein